TAPEARIREHLGVAVDRFEFTRAISGERDRRELKSESRAAALLSRRSDRVGLARRVHGWDIVYVYTARAYVCLFKGVVAEDAGPNVARSSGVAWIRPGDFCVGDRGETEQRDYELNLPCGLQFHAIALANRLDA